MPGESTIHPATASSRAGATSSATSCAGPIERGGHLGGLRIDIGKQRIEDRRLAHSRLADQHAALSFDPRPHVWDDGALTFGELDRRASAFAENLAACGVKAGDNIALSIGNHWAFAVALIAGWKLGATVAPLDKLLKEEERAEILDDLAPALFVDETDVAVGQPRGVAEPAATGAASGAALILYTPGSTGHPRARCFPTRRSSWRSSRGRDRSWHWWPQMSCWRRSRSRTRSVSTARCSLPCSSAPPSCWPTGSRPIEWSRRSVAIA